MLEARRLTACNCTDSAMLARADDVDVNGEPVVADDEIVSPVHVCCPCRVRLLVGTAISCP